MRRPTRPTELENPRIDADGWTDDHLTLMDILARKRIASYANDPSRQPKAPEPPPAVPRVTPAMTPEGRHRPAIQRYWMDVAAARKARAERDE